MTPDRNYDDMLFMERPLFREKPPMPMNQRASQFAPFAALQGYEESLDRALYGDPDRSDFNDKS